MAKEKFNMWVLIDLYKNNLDKWREYLYDNMSVFWNVKNIINMTPYYAKDIYNDIFLILDRVIQESIVKWFDEKQIYTYIKTRVRWEIYNRAKKHWWEVWSEYWADEEEVLHDDYKEVNNSFSKEIIEWFVYTMEEPYKTVVLLTHFFTPPKTFKQIWNLLRCKEQKVHFYHKEAMDLIRAELWKLQLDEKEKL